MKFFCGLGHFNLFLSHCGFVLLLLQFKCLCLFLLSHFVFSLPNKSHIFNLLIGFITVDIFHQKRRNILTSKLLFFFLFFCDCLLELYSQIMFRLRNCLCFLFFFLLRCFIKGLMHLFFHKRFLFGQLRLEMLSMLVFEFVFLSESHGCDFEDAALLLIQLICKYFS